MKLTIYHKLKNRVYVYIIMLWQQTLIVVLG